MSAEQFTHDVFLSHSSAKDMAVVRAASLSASTGERAGVRCRSFHSLRFDGFRLWFDEWEIKPGDSIPAKIEEGLERSRVLVLCMSANAFGLPKGFSGQLSIIEVYSQPRAGEQE